MVHIARESKTDALQALTRAKALAGAYVQPGWSTVAHSWAWPAYVAWLEKSAAHYQAVRQMRGPTPPEDVFYLDETRVQRGFSSPSLTEALVTGEWQATMRQRVPITRAWGLVGLCWALLLEELQRGRPQGCQRCGKPLAGRKTFCGPADDRTCYRARRALDRARERSYHARR
jgi:hypothetical protein